MNAFEAQQQVDTGFVQLTKSNGEIFRFIILNRRVQALTLNDLPLKDGDERGPSYEDLNDRGWEVYHACRLDNKRGVPLWFTGFQMSSGLESDRHVHVHEIGGDLIWAK